MVLEIGYRHTSETLWGSVPDYHNYVNHNGFAHEGSCLWFVKTAASVNHNKLKHNKGDMPVFVPCQCWHEWNSEGTYENTFILI